MSARKFAAALAVVLLVTTGASSAQQPFNRFEVFSVLDTYLESLRQQASIPGMSAAVVKDGVILWERGYGFQDLGARIRATPDTPYLAGNVGETLAAVLLLQCVEQRHLELDDPVTKYGVTFPDADVTVRQVLSHTSTEGPGGAFQYNAGALHAAHHRHGVVRATVLQEECGASHPQQAGDEGFGAGHRPEGPRIRASGRVVRRRRHRALQASARRGWLFPTGWTARDGRSARNCRR